MKITAKITGKSKYHLGPKVTQELNGMKLKGRRGDLVDDTIEQGKTPGHDGQMLHLRRS